MSEENKQIVRKYREIHNRGALDELDAIVAPNLVSHSLLPGLPQGLESGKQAHRIFQTSFADTVNTTDDLIAEGDKVVERYTSRGTHTGPFMGAPATGKPYAIDTIVIYRLKDGKIVEMWGLNDAMALMAQLGMMQAPA